MPVGKQIKSTSPEADNSKIINEQTYKPTTADNANARPILGLNVYDFMSYSYHGTEGYIDGSFLVPHSREIFYDGRRELAFYKNYVKPVVRAMIDPVFNSEISREVSQNGKAKPEGLMVHGFIDNCDNAGSNLHQFMDTVVTTGQLHGVVFVIVDNFPKEEHPANTKEAIENRKFPYLYMKKASQVHKWKMDKFGNLEWIMFCEKDEIAKNTVTGVAEKQKRYLKIDKVNFYKMGKSAKGDGEVEIEARPHEIGRMPVISCYFTDRTDIETPLVHPPHYDIARINHQIFNKDSEIRDQERAQGFSILYVQSDQPGDFNVGTHNLLNIPMDSKFPPGFASPDPNILKGLMENGKELREDLLRIAGQRGIIGVTAAKSGVAMQWDFRAEEAPLKSTSMKADWLEHEIIKIFQLYTPNEVFEYHAEYPDNFKPINIDENIKVVDSALLMGMPRKAAAILKRMVFKSITKKQDEDDVSAALAEFDEQTEPTPGNTDNE